VKYRTLGRTGVQVSSIVLGGDNILNPTPERDAIRMIHRAIDCGINLIDTSNSYMNGESERVIGKALKLSGKRQQLLVATKVHYPVGLGPNDRGNSRLHITRACEDSLRRLGTDYIDLYQTHRPEFNVPLDETLRAMSDLVRQGKVRYLGSSTAPAWHLVEALMTSDRCGLERFVSEQPPYNLLDRRIENELVPMCQRYGLALFPWSPMAMGILAGRYKDGSGFPPDSRAALRGGIYAERVTSHAVRTGIQFTEISAEFALHPAQLAILWVKDQQGVTAPIVGPRTMAQLETLIPVGEMRLTDEMRAACGTLVPPGSAVADFHNTAPWMKMRVNPTAA
jgi:aryl-alcohol dehydrogenase-like predicted oxidoreductase